MNSRYLALSVNYCIVESSTQVICCNTWISMMLPTATDCPCVTTNMLIYLFIICLPREHDLIEVPPPERKHAKGIIEQLREDVLHKLGYS